jgi:hypothetical protein
MIEMVIKDKMGVYTVACAPNSSSAFKLANRIGTIEPAVKEKRLAFNFL